VRSRGISKKWARLSPGAMGKRKSNYLRGSGGEEPDVYYEVKIQRKGTESSGRPSEGARRGLAISKQLHAVE